MKLFQVPVYELRPKVRHRLGMRRIAIAKDYISKKLIDLRDKGLMFQVPGRSDQDLWSYIGPADISLQCLGVYIQNTVNCAENRPPQVAIRPVKFGEKLVDQLIRGVFKQTDLLQYDLTFSFYFLIIKPGIEKDVS